MSAADDAMARSHNDRAAIATSATAGRQRWIDIAKGVAILAVVAYHTLLFLSSGAVGVADFGRIRIVLEMFPMPAFFLLAGMLQPRMLQATWRQVWTKRLLPFAYLYVLWCTVRFGFFAALPFVRSDGEWTSGRDPWTLLIAPLLPTSVYWFLWALFVITLAVWLLRRLPPALLLAASGVVSVLFSSSLVSTGIFSYDRTLQYAFFFVVGVTLSARITAFVHRRGALTATALLAGYVAIAVIVSVVPLARKVPGVVLLGQLCVLLGLFIAFRLLSRAPGMPALGALGGASLAIYVVHIYFVAGATIVVRALPFLHDVPPRGIPVFVGTVVVVLAASVLAGRLAARARWLLLPPRWLTGAPRRRRAAATPPRHRPDEGKTGRDVAAT